MREPAKQQRWVTTGQPDREVHRPPKEPERILRRFRASLPTMVSHVAVSAFSETCSPAERSGWKFALAASRCGPQREYCREHSQPNRSGVAPIKSDLIGVYDFEVSAI